MRMDSKAYRTATFALFLLLLGGVLLGSSPRKALVIGNSAYEHTTPLANPVNDANDIAASLEQFGFTVRLVTDATAGEMEREIRSFTSDVDATPTETALFYYAGHGVQFEGVNYLLPVNADIQETFELLDEAVSIDRVTNGLERSGSTFNLIMLDACRDNPFSSSRSATRGLTVMGAGGSGSMVVFATAPGAVAQDGSGRNSPFTEALLKHIETPDIEIRNLITEVQRTVSYTTGGKQIPWVNTSFTGEFYFRSAEDQLARSQTELSELEGELAALDEEIAKREAAIASASTSEERQSLELEQQRAKALEQAKQLEAERLADLQKQAEEVLSSRVAQDALREEMEARLSAQQEELARQADRRRAELTELQAQTESTDDLRSRLESIAGINHTIVEIRQRYEKVTLTTIAELERLYLERVATFQSGNPRDPWETAKEHEARLQSGTDELQAEYKTERKQQEQELSARLESELESLERQLQQAKAELNGRRFTPGTEATAVEVKPFNAEEKRFPVNLRIADSSIAYTVPLSYDIESQDRNVIRDEYYRVFSAYESNALVGQAEYAVYELEPDVWGIFPLLSEVVNLLENDTVLISRNTKETSVRIGSPLVLFTAKDQVVTSLPASGQFQDTLLVTGLPAGAVLDNGKAQATAADGPLLLGIADKRFTLNADSRWFAEPVSITVSRDERPDDLVWVDFSTGTKLVGELFIPRSDLQTAIRPEGVSSEKLYQDSRYIEEGVLFRLEPGVYTASFRLPEDRYDSRQVKVAIEQGRQLVYDPGNIDLSLPYRQELKLEEQKSMERRIENLPIRQAASYGLLGAGAVGIIGSVLSYLNYAEAVERYQDAVLTEDAQTYRQEASLWSTLFSVSLGVGVGGGAGGGYLLATAPNRFDLETERKEIERHIQELNNEAAARKAREVRDAFMSSEAVGWYAEGEQTAASEGMVAWEPEAGQETLAVWRPMSSYTVFFSGQGGTSGDPAQRMVTNGFPYGELPIPVRTGYAFDGWWTEPEGKGKPIVRESIVSLQENQTLYAKWTALEVGGPGPAGGLVLYDKGSYSDGWRYMEAAPYGWFNGGADPEIQWGPIGTLVGGTSSGIGTGASNTDKIVTELGAGTYAAKVCADYSVTVNGVVYDDWFLPSKDELNLMYQNLHRQGKGGFSSGSYWSSSEGYFNYAWRQYFTNGYQYNYGKYTENRVRPVRAF
jgi:uncharacterized repeat protein (TIGR02543 family)